MVVRGKGELGSLGRSSAHCYVQMDNQLGPIVWHMELYSTVAYQSGWEGGLEESRYMYMCGRVPSLFTRIYHNITIGYTPIQNKKFKVWGKKTKKSLAK